MSERKSTRVRRSAVQKDVTFPNGKLDGGFGMRGRICAVTSLCVAGG